MTSRNDSSGNLASSDIRNTRKLIDEVDMNHEKKRNKAETKIKNFDNDNTEEEEEYKQIGHFRSLTHNSPRGKSGGRRGSGFFKNNNIKSPK